MSNVLDLYLRSKFGSMDGMASQMIRLTGYSPQARARPLLSRLYSRPILGYRLQTVVLYRRLILVYTDSSPILGYIFGQVKAPI